MFWLIIAIVLCSIRVYRQKVCCKHTHEDVIIETEISVLQCMRDTLQFVLVLTYLLYTIERRCTKYCFVPYMLQDIHRKYIFLRS